MLYVDVQAAMNVEVGCIVLSVSGQTTIENEKLFVCTSTAITASYTSQNRSIAYIAKYSILRTGTANTFASFFVDYRAPDIH